MKTTIKFKMALVLLAGLFVMQSLSAANTSPIKSKNKEIEKTIHSYFKFPQVLMPNLSPLKNETLKVEVLFTTNNIGNVNFVLAKTNNAELKKEIENQFMKLKFKNLKNDVVNSITLNFRTN